MLIKQFSTNGNIYDSATALVLRWSYVFQCFWIQVHVFTQPVLKAATG